MRLFVAGPGENSGGTPESFADARRQLEDAGYEAATGFYVFTGPFRLDDWFELTRHDLDDCQGIALLPGSACSPGTQREIDHAAERGIRCRSVDWWWRHRGSSAVCDCADE